MIIRRKFTDDQKAAIVKEFVLGAKVGDVLAKHSVVSSVFSRWRRELESKVRKQLKADQTGGVEQSKGTAVVVRGRGVKLSPEMQEQIKGRLLAGDTPRQAAAALGLNVNTVYGLSSRMRKRGALNAAPAENEGSAGPPMVSSAMRKFAERTEVNIIRSAASQGRRFTWGEKQAILLVAMVTGEAIE